MSYFDFKYKTPWNQREAEDSGDCLDFRCEGKYIIEQDGCYCGTTSCPPCSNCEHSWLECDTCGVKAEEFE